MKHTILRLFLLLVAVGAAGAAAYYIQAWEVRAAAVRQSERAFEEEAARLQVTLADLRTSQAAYLAADQDPAFWAARTTALRQQADGELARLASSASGSDAGGELATATESLAAFDRFDGRIRELLQDGQPLTATSLVFSDAAQLTVAASNAVAGVRGARARATGAELADLRRFELNAAAGAGAVILLMMLLLVPGTRRRADSGETAAGAAAGEIRSGAIAPGLSPVAFDEFRRQPADVTAMRGAPSDPLEAPPPAAPAVTASPSAAASDTPTAGVDLLAAARLCADLAKVRDTSELPALLARAAAVLEASGIVVWMSGQHAELFPAFSYGYSPQALARMQSLPQDGGTAVSVAFRKAAMEVVPAEDQISGAIVAPIVTSNGCTGVMAVEMPPGAETSAGTQAVSNIIAAQLATLVAGEAA